LHSSVVGDNHPFYTLLDLRRATISIVECAGAILRALKRQDGAELRLPARTLEEHDQVVTVRFPLLRRMTALVWNGNAFSGVYLSLSSQVIVMILQNSIGLAFAGACLTAIVTMPAHADTARQNVIQSERYDRLLETNRAFRQARMRKECGPITDPQLHEQCLASFSQDEPMVASAASHRRVASSRHHAKQYVGSSAGPRHYQSHLGK